MLIGGEMEAKWRQRVGGVEPKGRQRPRERKGRRR